MQSNIIHIASAADEKYKKHLMAMVSSAISSAGSKYKIVFHLWGDGFSNESTLVFEGFIAGKGHEINWLEDISRGLDIPITMYFTRAASFRLFLADVIEDTVDTVIYLDSDTIVCDGGLERLANVKLDGHALAAVTDADHDFKYTRKRIGIDDKTYRYFNSGVLVINLKRWREENATGKHITAMTENHSKLLFVDQDILNLVWKDDVMYLLLNFNVTSVNYALPPKFLAKGNGSPYYRIAEIYGATETPFVLHFYGYMMNRPWKKACYHPKKNYYMKAANESPYRFAQEKTSLCEMLYYVRIHYLGYPETVIKRMFFGAASWVKSNILMRK